MCRKILNRSFRVCPARCPLFGCALLDMKWDNQYIRQTFLRPETQSRLGIEGYDAGAKILPDFFKTVHPSPGQKKEDIC